MPASFSVKAGDVAEVASDLLLLKHADGFHGADSAIAEILTKNRLCDVKDIALAPDMFHIVETRGIIAPARVMFLGTPGLGSFQYDAMRKFAARAVQIIAEQSLPVKTMTTTIHGVGYGLDACESLNSLVCGFRAGQEAHSSSRLAEIGFVERNKRRASILANALSAMPAPRSGETAFKEVADVPRPADGRQPTAPPVRQPTDSGQGVEPSRAEKRHVFVAMPFSEEFEDTYVFGIYTPVRECGLICEKTSDTSFTGDILQRIRDRIESAWLVIADLTGSRPNVYLEVGYAWGRGVPVVLVARHGEQLHFDVTRHRCIYYTSIRQLARELEKLIRGLLAGEERRS